MRRSLSILALLAAGWLLSAPAGAENYPTDQCVKKKLRSAGITCQRVAGAVGLDFARRDGRLEQRLANARDRLIRDFAAADAHSAEAGVSCEETTASGEEMFDVLVAGATSLGEAALETGPEGKAGDRCAQRYLGGLARSCREILTAYGVHIGRRDRDREQKDLSRSLDRALGRLETRIQRTADGCGGDESAEAVADAFDDWVAEGLKAAIVSPAVPEEFTEVVPDELVAYRDELLDPICSAGTPWSFWVRRGTVNKLLVYYQGGGACWSGLTCGGLPELGIGPTFKQSTGPFDNPANFSTGFADRSNPDNPFRDWHQVFVPYCTGDVHWGDAIVDHDFNGRITRIYHKGYVNGQVAEKWAREHFVFPEQVFVTGSSAGAYGAIVNSLPMQEHVYPSSDFAVLGDAGNGVITDDFLENDLAKWGIEDNLPEWIPALNVPLAELDAADLWSESAVFYPQNRFATYTASYDGGTGGQTGFYNIMLNPNNVLVWSSWWLASCEWNDLMLQLNDEAVAQADNYRFYVGAGSRHTMWGSNKVYSDTTGNVPTIRDWVAAMIEGNGDWTNVLCDDCDDVLPGDPRPNPPEPPFTADDRIECEEPPPLIEE